MLLGGIEAGGTKMVLAVGDENGNIFEKATIPTDTPDVSVPKMIDFFKGKGIEALGIGCFGPVDLHRGSKTFGYITTTPKPKWGNFDFAGAFREALNIPVGFDLDVNAAMLGEVTWGAARPTPPVSYIVSSISSARVLMRGVTSLISFALFPRTGSPISLIVRSAIISLSIFLSTIYIQFLYSFKRYIQI